LTVAVVVIKSVDKSMIIHRYAWPTRFSAIGDKKLHIVIEPVYTQRNFSLDADILHSMKADALQRD